MQRASIFILLFWCVSTVATAANVTVHYKSITNNYDGWGLHIWAGEEMVNGKEVGARTDFRLRKGTTPADPLMPSKFDDFGVAFTIPVRPDAKQFSYTLTNGELHHMKVEEWKWIKSKHGMDIWIVEKDPKIYTGLPRQFANSAKTATAKKTATPPKAKTVLPPPVPKVKATTTTAKAKVAPKPKPKAKSVAKSSGPSPEMKRTLAVLKDDLTKKNRSINKLQSALNDTQKINQRLQNDLNSKLIDYQALLQLNDKISNENRTLTASNQSLYSQVEQAGSSNAEAQLLERNQQLENQLAGVNEQILGLQKTISENTGSSEQQKQLQDQFNQMQTQRDELRDQNNKLSAHIVELVQRTEDAGQPEQSGIAWWLFGAVVAVLVALIGLVFFATSKRHKDLQLDMEDALKRKEEEIKTEKIYAAAANEKLRKVLHGEAQQRSWSPLPDSLPENLKKDSA
ncbi:MULTISPECIES: pullulanase-associated domain-containing protein [unclassified Agarivorans]|uniref:pullulanase-associated domain-containing protein n=1 Tax=unclassified Agarivorans TaxID=2636026 RepID=UPI0026E21070|nr:MULTISPECIES: pullulanase-associated domain-containing protein [unclassified Agarivorans]MDO6684540.1 pullulanase-associated domain-containing protein [Agarivorans sp. 3_MG-2023]MDO6714705.1 pullulanase-associated domain-containing protein [Agarivorans sp. 2_MG-2023]